MQANPVQVAAISTLSTAVSSGNMIVGSGSGASSHPQSAFNALPKDWSAVHSGGLRYSLPVYPWDMAGTLDPSHTKGVELVKQP